MEDVIYITIIIGLLAIGATHIYFDHQDKQSDYIEIDYDIPTPTSYSWLGINENGTLSSYFVNGSGVWRDGVEWTPEEVEPYIERALNETEVLSEYIRGRLIQLNDVKEVINDE